MGDAPKSNELVPTLAESSADQIIRTIQLMASTLGISEEEMVRRLYKRLEARGVRVERG